MKRMRPRPVRGSRWTATATCVLVVSVAGLTGCGGGPAAPEPTGTSHQTTGRVGTSVRVLQMNLCNSGLADCFSHGRAVDRAVALIDEHRPDMVSLNEVCRGDLHVLERAMSAAFPEKVVASAFASAKDRQTHGPVLCQNGQEYGNGILVEVAPSSVRSSTDSGVYPAQDAGDSEDRVWVCIDVATRFAACTTHTTSTSSAIALDQCRYLLDEVVPRLRRRDGVGATVLGADLNLAARGSPSPDSCLPDGYQRADDGGLQDVVVSPGTSVGSPSVIDMQGTTDHPGLLVDVTLAGY